MNADGFAAPPTGPERGPTREVALLFLKLGFIAFGGPAAHVALMRDETVRRRRWLTDQQFLDLLGASNLIPGPTSTELAIYLGYTRAGWRGLVLAGALFILPAMLIVLALARAYVSFGTTPTGSALLYGVKPVIIAIILQALWGLGQTAIKGALLAALGIGVLGLYLLGVSPVVLIFGGGLLVALVANGRRALRPGAPGFLLPLGLPVGLAAAAAPVSLGAIFLTFLKFGVVVYGSGYVLLAFLRDDLVNRLGWISDQQLLDAIAVGQFTPGPVFTTATFIGYLVAGVPGALVATLGIFLPSFVLVAAIYPLVPRLRASPWTGAFLDGVNVAALGLMAAVTIQLGQAALTDALTIAIAGVAGLLAVRYRVNTAWLVLGGAAVGLIARGIAGG